MIDPKSPKELADADLEDAAGGAGFIELPDIDGESLTRQSADMAIKPELTGGKQGIRASGIRATNIRATKPRFRK